MKFLKISALLITIFFPTLPILGELEPETLKITVREYGSSNQGTVHSTVYFDGGGAATFHQPSLTITSIGAAYNG